jgi:hypothetical protein
LVNGIGVGTRCFINDGKGHFTERLDSGLVRKYGSTSMALADIDGDGDLDLYVTNYRTDTFRDRPPYLHVQVSMADGKPVFGAAAAAAGSAGSTWSVLMSNGPRSYRPVPDGLRTTDTVRAFDPERSLPPSSLAVPGLHNLITRVPPVTRAP